MIRNNIPMRRGLLGRSALGLSLAMGIAAAGASGTPAFAQKAGAKASAKAPKIEFSKAFAAAAAELDKTVAGASANPAAAAARAQVSAAKTPAEKAAAGAAMDAALGGARAKLVAVNAAATTTGDKLKAGELTRNVGVLTGDVDLQHRGLVAMLNSGGLQPAQAGQIQYLAGVTAYQKRDYAGAISYLRPAMDSGYRDKDGLLQQVLADSYKRTGNTAEVMRLTQQDLRTAQAAGGRPSETSLRTALQAAYDARQAASANDLATQLVRYYPTARSWADGIMIVRALGQFPAQDNLDLMRLMARTGALSKREDYIEYIQDADPRRLPGETLKLIESGVASGQLKANDTFVAEARTTANARVTADRASLPGLERDARSGRATAVTIAGAADAFLSYGQPAKAEELYRIALGKPGVDNARVLTRLGIAQVDQGKFAEAQATFGRVDGQRKPLAQLWATYAASRVQPAG